MSPEGVGALTLAVFGVEGQPDGFRVLDLVGGETQVPLDGGRVERAAHDTLDDLVVLSGDTGQLLDDGHDDPLPCRRLLRCDLQR